MKENCNMSQRFVKEFANYKIREMDEMERDFPSLKEKHDEAKAKISKMLTAWERQMVTTREIMDFLNWI